MPRDLTPPPIPKLAAFCHERGMPSGASGSLIAAWGGVALALLVAYTADWLLRRLTRRVPRRVARWRGIALDGATAPGERALWLLLLPVRLVVWLVAFDTAAQQFPRQRQALLAAFADGLWTPLFEVRGRTYMALDVVLLPAAFVVAWLIVRVLTQLLERYLLASAGLERGVRQTVVGAVRYIALFLCTLAILQVWGFDMTSLAVLASVLGVGIGFGLQNIANNFVSGLVISLERPVKLGDFVRVGEWTGTVERIGARCVEISTTDRVTILVPNSRFLEHEVINWSHGDPRARIHIPVGVAYGSSVARVRTALLEAAKDHPSILRDPRPDVEFRRFGDSSLDFELLVWTLDPRRQERLKSDMNYRIEASLGRHGIQVPFPQRDLHLRTPELSRLLRRWGVAPDEDGKLSAPHTADMAVMTSEIFESGVAPREWSQTQLDAAVERMRGPGGVDIRDRRHLFSVYPHCFVGREAVDWMVAQLGLSREEAIDLGQMLFERGTLRHVLDEHPFRDDNLFYRFCGDAAES